MTNNISQRYPDEEPFDAGHLAFVAHTQDSLESTVHRTASQYPPHFKAISITYYSRQGSDCPHVSSFNPALLFRALSSLLHGECGPQRT